MGMLMGKLSGMLIVMGMTMAMAMAASGGGGGGRNGERRRIQQKRATPTQGKSGAAAVLLIEISSGDLCRREALPMDSKRKLSVCAGANEPSHCRTAGQHSSAHLSSAQHVTVLQCPCRRSERGAGSGHGAAALSGIAGQQQLPGRAFGGP